jgi:hypothetical protein
MVLLMLLLVAAALICWALVFFDKTFSPWFRVFAPLIAYAVLGVYLFGTLIPAIRPALLQGSDEIEGGAVLMLVIGLGLYLGLLRGWGAQAEADPKGMAKPQ